TSMIAPHQYGYRSTPLASNVGVNNKETQFLNMDIVLVIRFVSDIREVHNAVFKKTVLNLLHLRDDVLNIHLHLHLHSHFQNWYCKSLLPRQIGGIVNHCELKQ